LLTRDSKSYLELRYNDFIPVLTKAIQEQQQQMEELKKQNESLLQRLQALEKGMGSKKF